MKLIIAHLYPQDMNIYGDRGNITALTYRLKQRQIDFEIIPVNSGTDLKMGSFDLLFGGGGQDSQQAKIAHDLLKQARVIKAAVSHNIPMLLICGTYQLFGHYFQPFNSPKLTGIGVFNAYTKASSKRKIGNILLQTKWGKLVGFENHSGNTWLTDKKQALGQVIHGFGNNGSDKTEGAVNQNAFGCYLHGPLLPKNPHFSDYLLEQAIFNKYGLVKLRPLNDALETKAREAAINQTRKLHHTLLKYF